MAFTTFEGFEMEISLVKDWVLIDSIQTKAEIFQKHVNLDNY